VRRFALIVALFALGAAPPDDLRPQTRAERTDYRETSSHADVFTFLEALVGRDGPVSFRSIGQTAQGRDIFLAVVAKPGTASALQVQRNDKVVVYIQANIHGGEVEGKEAALMLLRQLAQRRNDPLLNRLVLVVVPDFNPDGNDALGDGRTSRPSQDGPDRVGRRANGQGLDLNRDAMKAEAPETRAVLAYIYRAWDPDVILDLHTTNGTRHGFHLTYSPPLNPNTDPGVLAYARDALLPGVRLRLEREKGLRLFDYGNVETRGGVQGWYTFGDEGRYVTNYAGLRNRVGILSEAASFLPFRVRVETTLAFVRAVLDQVAREADRVRALTREADARRSNPEADPGTIGVRFEPASRGREPVPLEVVAAGEVVDHRKAPARVQNRDLPILDRFRATRTARLPRAYLLPAELTEVVALLRRHGVTVERLTEPWVGEAEAFTIAEVATSPGRFQNRRMVRLEGRLEARRVDLAAGTFLVGTAQPLGTLAAVLLEPESLDGVAAWGLLEGTLAKDKAYPILKSVGRLTAKAEPVP
jgi:hypothetical protein